MLIWVSEPSIFWGLGYLLVEYCTQCAAHCRCLCKIKTKKHEVDYTQKLLKQCTKTCSAVPLYIW